MPSASTTAARTASRRSACSASGCASSRSSLLGLAGDLQVRASRLIPWWLSECSIRSHSSRARASTSVSGTSTVASRDDGVEHGLAELGLDARARRPRARLRDVLAQLVERVEAGGVGGEVVVELGQLLALDLLDRDLELARPAGEVLGAVVVGEGDRDRALVAGLGAAQLVLEAGDEPAASRAR